MGIYAQKYKDIVAFGKGSNGKITDQATVDNLTRYLSLDSPQDVRLKKCFFAVLLHGWVSGTNPGAAWDVNMLCSEINKYWDRNPRRALLLISCLTGYGLIRQVSRKLAVPVVAPQSFAYINFLGGLMSSEWNEDLRKTAGSVKGYNIQERPFWLFCDMDGVIKKVSEFPGLKKDTACEMAEKWINGN